MLRCLTAVAAIAAAAHLLGCDFPKLPDLEDPIDGPIDPAPVKWGLLMANARTRDGNAVEPIRAYVLNDVGIYKAAWQSDELDWGRSVTWGDFDADGHSDFAIGNGYLSRGRNRIYRNKGDGTFSVHWTASIALYTNFVTWADVDGDGDLDLVALADDIRLFRNNAGVFNPDSELLIRNDYILYQVTFDDIDRDRDLDAILATSAGVFVYRNDGVQGLVEMWRSDAQGVSAVKCADYDKDGRLDIGVGMSLNGGVKIFRQQNGSFVELFSSAVDINPPVVAATQDVDWLDYDKDGDLDLVAAHCQFINSDCEASQNRVYRNSGGTFSVGWVAAESEIASSVSVADYDNDGLVDLAFGSISGLNRVYRNLGGSFAQVWVAAESESTNDISWIPFP